MIDSQWVAGIAVVCAAVGFLLAKGWNRGRHAMETEKARTDLSIELASVRERATRIPALEQQVSRLLVTEQSHQAELLQLSKTEAEKGQLLESTAEQLKDAQTKLADAERQIAAYAAQLSASSERKATLESEVSRVPELERRLTAAEDTRGKLTTELADLKEFLGRSSAELTAERESLSAVREELAKTRKQLDGVQAAHSQLTIEKTDLTTRLEAERNQSQEKLQLLNEAKQTLSDQFKTLATEILEDKSRRFTEQNQTNLGQLLDPLKLKLAEFQTKVEDVYVNETRDRSALSEQVRQLLTMNQSLSQDAKNLTLALKGSNKAQGNYGELVLERLLEASGLRKGHEYEAQASHTREDGSRAQPDVVVRLPEDRNLVIDSKASLVAYDESVNAADEHARSAALSRHIASVRAHIKGLSEKNYHALYELKSLDFVLMFIPIEPAFMVAVTNDGELFMDAWNRNVLLVSPSTLMFVVRTVAHLWRQEAQSRNAQEIANRGAELYDRLCAFVADLEKLGDRLRQAQDSYNDARDKLSKNKGNVIRQAEMLKKLGVKPAKALPISLVGVAMDADDEATLDMPEDEALPQLSAIQ